MRADTFPPAPRRAVAMATPYDVHMTLEEKAIELLLRSPRLDVGTIIDLLDVGDREFRDMARRNETICNLLEARRSGKLEPPTSEPAQCPVCTEWFVPYGASKYCSDACRTAGRINQGSCSKQD